MRNPEANVDVYALGHYEQMQISLALDHALRSMAWLSEPMPGQPKEEDPFNKKTIRGLLKVFASHGTTTIIRTNDKE